MKINNKIPKIVILVSVFMLSLIPLAQAGQGFIVTTPPTLSTILHPGQSASQTQWIVTVSLNGGGQSLAGTLTSSNITYQGFTSVYPLQISASTNPEQAFYIINNAQPTPIYSYTYLTEYGGIKKGLILVNLTSAPACPSTDGSATYYSEWDTILSASGLGAALGNFGSTGQTTTIRTCIYQQPIGYEAGIGQVNQLFSSVFSLSANGQTESLTISSNNQSATSSDGNVQINWDGSLITGTGVPEAGQYVAISNDQQSQSWTAASESAYSSYQGQYSSTSSQLSSKTFTPTTSGNNYPSPCSSILTNISQSYLTDVGNCLGNNVLQGILTQNNNDASALQQSVSIGGYNTQSTSYQGQTAFLVTLPSQFVTTNPQITMRINGAFLGVVIPEGTPQILSATSKPFNSGNGGTISIDVKNIGNSAGSFYISLGNCDGIQSSTSPNYAFSSGEVENLSLPIYTSGANSNLSEQCLVTVTDANGGGSNSTEVNVQMKQANECTPGVQIVQGSSICSCINDNGVYKPGSCNVCQYGVISNSSGSYICADKPAGINTNVNSNSTSKVGINTNSSNSSFIINAIILPVATNLVVPAVCSSTGPLDSICSGILDYFIGSI